MKCQYRMRWFSSKGAFLVLVWTLLVFFVSLSFYYFIKSTALRDKNFSEPWLIHTSVFISFVSAPLSGWLADAKFGNYRVFKAGTLLLFISLVMNCLMIILEILFSAEYTVLKWIHLYLDGSLFVIGACACVVTALPLGLDQMPDAPSTNITSYIAWFVCSIFVGTFFANGLYRFAVCTADSAVILIWSLFVTICIGVILICQFLFRPKWLIVEGKAPQSLKIIYQILKFAAKPKSFFSRSALTYWEETKPSRIDLGKSKYGGPFTTEQVEDVKTVLRLSAIAVALFPVVFSIVVVHPSEPYPSQKNSSCSCPLQALSFLAYRSSLYSIIGVLGFEFLVYPFFRNIISASLKRIGLVLLLLSLFLMICFVLKLAHYLSRSPHETVTEWIVYFLSSISTGISSQVLITSLLSFNCAQSPYHMRGLIMSIIIPLSLISSVLGEVVLLTINRVCKQSWCIFFPFLVRTFACFVGFLLFCVMARWYKRRVRDEDYSPQRVVEEVYDRYLTAATAHSNTSHNYGSQS